MNLPAIPIECRDLKPNEWNKKQSKLYFDWFLGIKDERVRIFTDYFEFPTDLKPSSRNVLMVLERVIYEIIDRKWYFDDVHPGDKRPIKRLDLTACSVATDLALYFLSIAEKHLGQSYEWKIFSKYPRNYHERNLPHVVNPVTGYHRNPQEDGYGTIIYGMNNLSKLSFLLNDFRNLTGVDSEKVLD